MLAVESSREEMIQIVFEAATADGAANIPAADLLFILHQLAPEMTQEEVDDSLTVSTTRFTNSAIATERVFGACAGNRMH